MDRGYLDFVRLYAMHRAGAFFVTRAKENMHARRVYSFGNYIVNFARLFLTLHLAMPNGKL
jgi:hypothetical protein